MKKIYLISLLIIALSAKLFSQCNISNLTTSDGLFDNNVRQIIMDQNGTMYFSHSTSAGISVYNGTTWANLTTTTTSGGLADNYVTKMFYRWDHKLWCGTLYGISVLDIANNTWTNYNTTTGLPSNYIYDITEDIAGNIWIATDMGIVKYDGSDWFIFNQNTVPQLTSNYFNSISVDPNNNDIWFGSGNGAVKHSDTLWTVYTMADGLVNSYIDYVLVTDSSEVWLVSSDATYGGISIYKDSSFQNITYINSNPATEIYGITQDKYGDVWVGQYMGGVHKYNRITQSWTTYTTSDGLISNNINGLSADYDGNIWIGTDSGVSEIKHTANATIIPMITDTTFFPESQAYIKLYKKYLIDATNYHYELMYEGAVNTDGLVYFQEIYPANYIVEVINLDHYTYPNVLTTYFQQATKWEDATVVNFDVCTSSTLQVLMYQSAPVQNGQGKISGTVVSGSANNQFKSVMGEPIPGVQITLEQEPDDQPMMSTETNESGYFELLNCLSDTNTYRLRVNIPGVPMVTTYSGLTVADSSMACNFVLDTVTYTVGTTGKEEIQIDGLNATIKVYPNPANDYLKVTFNKIASDKITIELFDIAGTSLVNKTIFSDSNKEFTLNLKEIRLNGKFIFMRITENNNVYIKKIAIVK